MYNEGLMNFAKTAPTVIKLSWFVENSLDFLKHYVAFKIRNNVKQVKYRV